MVKPYGKFPGRYRNQAHRSDAAAGVKNLRIKINGRHDLEQTCFLLQRIIARLQDADVDSVERCALYLTPLNRAGERVTLKDEKGRPLETIEIALPVSSKFTKAAI